MKSQIVRGNRKIQSTEYKKSMSSKTGELGVGEADACEMFQMGEEEEEENQPKKVEIIEEQSDASSFKTQTEGSVQNSEQRDKQILEAELLDMTKGISGFVMT